jgi:hypothetical protein
MEFVNALAPEKSKVLSDPKRERRRLASSG